MATQEDEIEADLQERSSAAATDESTETRKEKRKHKHHKKEKRHKKEKKHRKKKDRDSEKRGSDEEEEDGEELNEYVQDDFVVDDVEEEEGLEDSLEADLEKKERKKSKKKKNYNLDEDDLILLADAQGIPRGRDSAAPRSAPQEFSRLKKNTDLKTQVQASLFGESDDEEIGAPEVEEKQEEEINFDQDSDDDGLGSFIVDVDEFGNPRQKPKNKVRKPRGVRSATTSQMREAEDVFGDGFTDYYRDGDPLEEGAEMEFDDGMHPSEPVDLESQFDQATLEELFLTKEDEIIRNEDRPERLQLRFGDRAEPTETELREEADWIYHKCFHNNEEVVGKMAAIQSKIMNIVEFLRKDFYEIPFIFRYKKGYFVNDLKMVDLWEIFDWDEKWMHFQARRKTLENLFEKAGVDEDHKKLLEEANTEIDLQDLMDHFNLYYAEELREADPTKRKRAVKRDMYRTCKKAGIIPMTKNFGLTAYQFGLNLMNASLTYEPTDPPKSPEDIALEFLCGEFGTPESVVRACSYVYAQEIAYEPFVRQTVRTLYNEHVEVSTFPTEKGKSVDAFHPYRLVLRLNKKPVAVFSADRNNPYQFLEILKAEKEGFITVKIEIPEEGEELVMKEMEHLFLSETTSGAGAEWNILKKQVLKDALTVHLYPLFEKELRHRLSEDAKDALSREISQKINGKLLAGPYKPPVEDENEKEDENIKIMACCYEGPEYPTMVAMLNAEGEVTATLRLGFVIARSTSIQDTRPQDDIKKLREFVEEHRPHCIAIGAHLEATRLYDEVQRIVEDVRKSSRRSPNIHVAYVDTEIPRIFASSQRALKMHPDFPPLLRQAISIGRLLQDPLMEMAGLCSNVKEITSLHLHPLQDMLGEDFLFNSLSRNFQTVVSMTGVDINKAVLYKHASNTLPFVSGLGPRKAMGLINNIYRKGGSRVYNREDLRRYMGDCVWTNCVGFLTIHERHLVHGGGEIEPLDETIIHPDDYHLVRKMAADALERDPEDEDLILMLMEHPRSLNEIDLDAFAEELAIKGKPKKRATLMMIKEEIQKPFNDGRNPYRDPSPDELFTLLTGESDATLHKGQLVSARVTNVQSKRGRINVRLDNGLLGFIKQENASDQQLRDLNDLGLEQGSVLSARIHFVHKENEDAFLVELTCRSSDLQDTSFDQQIYNDLRSKDFYFLHEDYTQPKKKKIQKKKPFLNRLIEHPFFQNVTRQQAEEYLKDKPIGEVVIRPGSRGDKWLSITWKFYENNYVNLAIREENKANARSLGKSLFIENERFEDLDEILARYIDPMTMFIQELVSFRNFQKGGKEEIERLLSEKKKQQPKTIPYLISIAEGNTGTFVLSYIPGSTRVRHEYIHVTHEGYRFRQHKATDPEKLVGWFKKHYKDAPPPSRDRDRDRETVQADPVHETWDSNMPKTSGWEAPPLGNPVMNRPMVNQGGPQGYGRQHNAMPQIYPPPNVHPYGRHDSYPPPNNNYNAYAAPAPPHVPMDTSNDYYGGPSHPPQGYPPEGYPPGGYNRPPPPHNFNPPPPHPHQQRRDGNNWMEQSTQRY
eukprot:TRINITY_DN1949_c0_g1_i1.p1 TRINITY_DN1949_c0_g1~~TRINITY_DN1949_c0_g1_i1.p1  ORF type:complete len:1550 (+),score=544.67 TRINITY_DN1949_c0_g1_i1:1495-6144(+)